MKSRHGAAVLLLSLSLIFAGCTGSTPSSSVNDSGRIGSGPSSSGIVSQESGSLDGFAGRVAAKSDPNSTVIFTSGVPSSPLASVLVTVEGTSVGTTTDQQGHFRLVGVPAGPQNLIFHTAAGTLTRRVTVVSQAQVRLGTEKLSRQQALQKVLGDTSQLTGRNLLMVESQNLIPAGTTLRRIEGPTTESLYQLREDSWLFFLDPYPNEAGFHPTVLVLLGNESGQMTSLQGLFWPTLNRQVLWQGIQSTDPDIVYFQAPPLPPGSVVTLAKLDGPNGAFDKNDCPPGKRYFIAIRGSNEGPFEDSILTMQKLLNPTESLILRQKGLEPYGLTYKEASKSLRRDSGMLAAAFASINAKVLPQDEIIFMFSGHGPARGAEDVNSWPERGLNLFRDAFTSSDLFVYAPIRALQWDVLTPPPDNPGGLSADTIYLGSGDLMSAFETVKCCKLTVILDCCFAYSLRKKASAPYQFPDVPLGRTPKFPESCTLCMAFASDESHTMLYSNAQHAAAKAVNPNSLVPSTFIGGLNVAGGQSLEQRMDKLVTDSFPQLSAPEIAQRKNPKFDKDLALIDCPCTNTTSNTTTGQGTSGGQTGTPTAGQTTTTGTGGTTGTGNVTGGTGIPTGGETTTTGTGGTPGSGNVTGGTSGGQTGALTGGGTTTTGTGGTTGSGNVTGGASGGQTGALTGGGATTGGTGAVSQPDISVFPRSNAFVHHVGKTACPQLVDINAITNLANTTTTVTITSSDPALTLVPDTLTIPPGEVRTFTIYFNCARNTSFMANLTYTPSQGAAKSYPVNGTVGP